MLFWEATAWNLWGRFCSGERVKNCTRVSGANNLEFEWDIVFSGKWVNVDLVDRIESGDERIFSRARLGYPRKGHYDN